MPILLDSKNYNINLRFKLSDKYKSKKEIEYWNKFRKSIINDKLFRENLIKDWLINCKLETNKNLPNLERAEGGVGGNDNLKNKQIRFMDLCDDINLKEYDDIVLYVFNTNDEKWTFEELDDLIYGFVKNIKDRFYENVCGVIEIENNKLDEEEDDE